MNDDPDEMHDAAGAARRTLLRAGLRLSAAAWAGSLGGCADGGAALGGARIGFVPAPASAGDELSLAPGITATVLARWGEPVGIAGAMPAWRPDASNSAAEQSLQLGQTHRGLHYLALDGSRRGLLVIVHAGIDDGLLHPGGMNAWSAEKVSKAQAATGVSVVEVEFGAQGWQLVRPSRHARRITAGTPVSIAGPGAGHPLLRTAADPAGRSVRGTFGGGACTATPWGTMLKGEADFEDGFATADPPTAHERRYGLKPVSRWRWSDYDLRCDTVRHPNEPNRHGWIVEFDPLDTGSVPVKRTALGRCGHRGSCVAVTRDGRAVVYSCDGGRHESIYKFVSRQRVARAEAGRGAAQANSGLLDEGTLFVARFEADGSGRWLPMLHGQDGLDAAAGYADAGEVVVKARQAADLLGATRLAGVAGLAIDRASGWVCAGLADERLPAAAAPGPDTGEARGRVIRWRDRGGFDSAIFEWGPLLAAGGAPAAGSAAPGKGRGGDLALPGAVGFDRRGLLWAGTAVGTAELERGGLADGGNNHLLACNPATGELRRLLGGPVHSAVGGFTWTPDGRTMFVDIAHPGEAPAVSNDPRDPRRYSNWPDFDPAGRPRSATVALRRVDGGTIGD